MAEKGGHTSAHMDLVVVTMLCGLLPMVMVLVLPVLLSSKQQQRPQKTRKDERAV